MIDLKIKSIKDAIHGYIRLEEPFWKIIDTAEFQRLKWIEQTSYRVLYPSARHDRFIHSIGVYHLGQKAICGFLQNCTDSENRIVKKYKDSFLMACLLHDIGHAPFSHTCEDLYNYKDKISNKDSKINKELFTCMSKCLTDSEYNIFLNDYEFILSPSGKSPSEHEVMSAIITCRKFNEYSKFFSKENRDNLNLDLVVRAILGCCYIPVRTGGKDENREKGIKNCLIRLLNSSTVDVDKLDYISRDTQMSGYDNIVLDTERLLDSICVVDNEGVYYPAFKKGALSIINNVVLAKNSQAKWIVNHPVVIYEAYILRRAIGEALSHTKIRLEGNKQLSLDESITFIFSSSSLSKIGNKYKNGTFSLLSDVDILNLMKNKIDSPCISEYFSRDERKNPIWKSNEEFLFYLGSDLKKAAEVAEYMAPLINYFNRIEDICCTNQIDKAFRDSLLKNNELVGNEDLIKIVNALLEYKDPINGIKDDIKYVILPAKSNFFATIDAKNLYIQFGDKKNVFTSYEELEGKHQETASKNYEFFYLYCNYKVNPQEFLSHLRRTAHNEIGIHM